MDAWLRQLPKAELHLHVEGTLKPELMFELARRNGVHLRYRTIEDARAACRFDRLQSFLDLYHEGIEVLRTPEDFRDLALAYFERAHADGVVHTDMSFDPQAHLARGIALEVPFEGLTAAIDEAEDRFGISCALVMSFLRDHDPEDALAVFEKTRPWHHRIAAIGMDNAEAGYPPGRFRAVYARAREAGLARTAHAGEEGPPAYIAEALDVLGVGRIDHGVRCVEDPALMARLRESQIPLTVCPLSNVSLRVAPRLADHPLPRMLAAGLNVSINSDDPAYFGGGVLANYLACRDAFGWDQAMFHRLAGNSIRAAYMPAARREQLLAAWQRAGVDIMDPDPR